MFDGVARRYDITNTVLSLAWTGRGGAALGRRLSHNRENGSSTSRPEPAFPPPSSRPYLVPTGCLRLLAGHAARRAGPQDRRKVPFVAGDALHLPFPDGVFDAATITFGLRNVADPDAALREMARVVRPGGRLVVCEFSRPRFAPFRFVYLRYLLRALPLDRPRVSSNADAYVYFAESIRAWPRAGRTGAAHRRQRMDRRAVAQPDRRGRRAAPWPHRIA